MPPRVPVPCEVLAGTSHPGEVLFVWIGLDSQKLQYFTGVPTSKQQIQLMLAVQLLTQCWQQGSEQADLVFFPED